MVRALNYQSRGRWFKTTMPDCKKDGQERRSNNQDAIVEQCTRNDDGELATSDEDRKIA